MQAVESGPVNRVDPNRGEALYHFKILNRLIDIKQGNVPSDVKPEGYDLMKQAGYSKLWTRSFGGAWSNLEALGYGDVAVKVMRNRATLYAQKEALDLQSLRARVLSRLGR